MKKIILLLLINCSITSIVYSQSFIEICENSSTTGTVIDYQYYNGTLYATGFFDVICGQPVDYIAKWENEAWKPSNISIADPGHSLRVIADKLYIAKYEESIDSNWVYVYDNSSLEKVGQGVYLSTASGFSNLPNIYDIIEYNGKIIACGEFDRVGTEEISGIMQWDGSTWEAMGAGLTGNIQNAAPVMFPHQLMVHDSELYVVGNFRNAGTEEVNGIAKWNGTEWMPMGVGFNNTVYSIAVYNDELIVGGSFTESGGTELNRIAKWSGTEWTALDFGFIENSTNDFIFVHTLKIIDEELYIGGGLKKIIYSDNTTEICNGIVGFSNAEVNTFNGGVAGFDIEAMIKTNEEDILIGGGVFGTGYTGILEVVSNVENVEGKNQVNVYPNPFKDQLDISTNSDFKNYVIYDNLGKTVSQGDYKTQLELQLSSGLYFLKLIGEKTNTVIKIVKE